MRYAVILALGILLSLTSVNPLAAQDRDRPSVIMEDDDVDRRDDRRSRGRTGEVNRGRGRSGGDVDRPRGRSGRDGGVYEQGGRADGDARERPRTERRRGDDRYDDDWEDDDRYDDYGENRGKRGNGPPFCRNGSGHPVFGMGWCREKGFGYGQDDYRERRRVEDILFPSPRRRSNDTMGGGILEDILGGGVLGRLGRYARSVNARGPLRARWLGDSELHVFAGNTPLVRFVDANADNRVDYVDVSR